MDEPTSTTTLPESVPAAEPAGSQVAAPAPQGTEPVQPGSGVTVETPVNQSASSPNGTRTKTPPSEYYRQRQKIQSLERTVNDLMKRIESTSAKPTVPEAKAPEKTDYAKKVWDDPVSVIDEMLEERVNQKLEAREQANMAQRQKQEALELIFKNEEVSSAGDEGYQRIIEIMKDRKLDAFARSHPVEAAQTALDIYAKKYPKAAVPQKAANPLAPKPGQMGSTQSGNVTAPGSQKEVSVEDLQNELRAIKKQFTENPESVYDPALVAKIAEIKKKLTLQTQK